MSERHDKNHAGPNPASRVRVELGRRLLELSELSRLGPGRAVELDCPCNESVDVYVDGRLFARGQAVSVDGRFAVRVSELPVEHRGVHYTTERMATQQMPIQAE